MRLIDYNDGLKFKGALKLAKTKYADDWAVQTWLRIYQNGIPNRTVKSSNKKVVVDGIKKHSDFAKKGLIKAVSLRERGKVMGYGKQKEGKNTGERSGD